MAKWLLSTWLLTACLSTRTALWLALIAWPLCGLPGLLAQGHDSHAADDSRVSQEHWRPHRLPDKPTLPPVFSIPVEPLGFSPPGPIYLGQRFSLVSLDFLDENRLLFTFRVPGLIRREHNPAVADEGEERHIRAVVLALPEGNVQAEALWTVHDRSRYLWMLKDGHFLLRDRQELRLGDAGLELKPYLQFPGPLLWLEMDPAQQYLVTNSREAPAAAPKPGDVPSPDTAKADVASSGEPSPGRTTSLPDMVLRILRRDSGMVMLVSRVRSPVHLPINTDGYVESLRGRGADWVLNLNFFSGGSTILGHVESSCSPAFDFAGQRELLVTACDRAGVHKLVAMTTDGRRLWEERDYAEPVWPILVMGSEGSRLARESLAVDHAVNAFSPLSAEDVKGQLVEVFDAANGNVALAAPATPVLDGGGNVAISPSGRRVAILNAGAIQVFDLPSAPLIPDPPGQPAR
jgi:hypothetical protein